MKKQEVIRAWRDPKFRRSLQSEQASTLPAHPAGQMMTIDDEVLTSVTGGCAGCQPPLRTTQPSYCSAICSPCPPWACY